MRLAICVLICSLGVAHAQPPDKVMSAAAYTDGQQRYAAGDFAGAAAKFVEAYASDPDPSYLFNAAQSFRFANDCVQAATYYRRFLAAVTSAPNLDKTKIYLDEMDACARRQRPPPPPPQPPVPPPPAPTPQLTISHADPGATQRHVGIAVAGAGLVAAAVGVWFHLRVGNFEQQVRDCTAANPCTTAQVDHLNARGHTASIGAITSYSIAGVALIGGGVVYLLGRSPPERPVAISPTRGGAMVTAGFAF